MAAVTAAVIAGAATIASTGAGIAAQQGAFGGGSGSGGSGGGYARTPLDPHQRAMRDYYARMVVENQDKTYPSFSEYLSSGGDPSKGTFDLTQPGMKPSEAAALGLTGGRGEAIPYYDVTKGEGEQTPEQRIYLAKERVRHAKETGNKMPPWTWAEATANTANRYDRITNRVKELQAMDPAELTRKQTRFLTEKAPERLASMEERHPKLNLGGRT